MSLLGRFLSRASRNLSINVRQSERLDLSVPTNKADVVRGAVEDWLGGFGVSAPVTAEPESDGTTRLSVSLGRDEAAVLDFSDKERTAELETVLFEALKKS